MAKRSCRASQNGLKEIRQKCNTAGLTQEGLAETAGVSRSTVSSFVAGRAIDRNNFVELCTVLDLNWEDIIERPAETELDNAEINTIVQAIREQIKPIIHQKCGTMRVLDMTQPIELTGERGIYTNVNLLERVVGRKRIEIAGYWNCWVERFNPCGLNRLTIDEERVPELEALEYYSKLLVLGKPGAGKTTLLKYLAMHCVKGNFQANCIPVFITLKDFAELEGTPGLFTYISQSTELSPDLLQKILQQGQMLVLLDGLDEVREEHTKWILKQILEFSDQFYRNQFVITCRIAAEEYTFERFTEVELADFDKDQIAIFARNWFPWGNLAENFIQKLKENKPIQELASNPLLLTMLCLVFGENADFPANRSELYKEGLDILLKKWDAKRNIQREQLYKNLSKKGKEDLLSQIALKAFEQEEYFFKRKTLENYVSDFICNLPQVNSDPEIFQMDGEAVLKSIEAQHGLFVERAKDIYSFSHLTFQKYFAAREITKNSAYQDLVQHLTEKRWHEVFLLTTNMMRNADGLLMLMKQKIDAIVDASEELQQLLTWIDRKAGSVKAPYKSSTVRAFYFDCYYYSTNDDDYALNIALSIIFEYTMFNALEKEMNIDYRIDCRVGNKELTLDSKDLALDSILITALHFPRSDNLLRALEYNLELAPELKWAIQGLNNQIPSELLDDKENWQIWWKTNRKVLSNQLRTAIIEHRNIGHDWQFSDEQKQLLQQYYDANKLLMDCLNSDCYVSRDVRQEIEDTLLLPMSEIDRISKL